jgi:hypothetical protein
VGPKPANCPSWVPDTPDGNDNDINYGALDDYGYLEELPEGETIRNRVTYLSNNTINKRLGIVKYGINFSTYLEQLIKIFCIFAKN